MVSAEGIWTIYTTARVVVAGGKDSILVKFFNSLTGAASMLTALFEALAPPVYFSFVPDVLCWIFLINLPAIHSVYFLDDRHRELDSQRINRMYRRAAVGCNTSRDIRRQRKSGSLRLYILN